MNTAIICACMPCLKAFFSHYFPNCRLLRFEHGTTFSLRTYTGPKRSVAAASPLEAQSEDIQFPESVARAEGAQPETLSESLSDSMYESE